MKQSTLIPALKVTAFSQLNRVLSRPLLTKSAGYRVSLNIPEISRDANERLEARSNHFLNSCGCREGMITGVVFIAIRLLFTGNDLVHPPLWDFVLLFLLGAVTGKLISQIILRLRINSSIKKLKRRHVYPHVSSTLSL